MIFSKHSLYISALGAALCLASCDNIDEDQRFIPVERPAVERVVLVEEFTGMYCVNCPNGAEVIHDTQQAFPESVIAVSLHPKGTPYTRPMGGLDLTCDAATEYFNHYKPSAFPAAMINGGDLNSNINKWTAEITEALAVPAPLSLSVTSDYDEASRTVTAKYEAVFNQMYPQACNIQLWLVENGIVGRQQSTSGLIKDYTHNHVLRAAINGNWGQPLGDSFATEQKMAGESSIQLQESWVAENCEVVAFVYRPDTNAVEQAAAVAVLP